MKTAPLLCIALTLARCCAETFVGPTSVTNRLTINTNEVLSIEAVGPDKGDNLLCTYTFDNALFSSVLTAWMGTSPRLFPGPGEVIITNQCLVRFTKRIRYDLAVIIISAYQTSNWPRLVVPAGKQIKFYGNPQSLGSVAVEWCYVTAGSTTFRPHIEPGAVFDGPLAFEFTRVPSNPQTPQPKVAALYSVTDSTNLKGPSIFVESSDDLTNWITQSMFKSDAGTNNFYRLHIMR